MTTDQQGTKAASCTSARLATSPCGPEQTEKTASTQSTEDETMLTCSAQDIQHARRALEQLPQVRRERVAELRRKIAEGTFEVSAEAVVDKLMRDGP